MDLARGKAFSYLKNADPKTPKDANSGLVLFWGSNTYFQLGVSDAALRQVIIAFRDPVVQVECGMYHTVVLTANGSLYGAGRNLEGQLGLAKELSVVNTFEPINFDLKDAIVRMSCGRYHTTVLTEKGDIYELGGSKEGWLKVKIPRKSESPIRSISCGGFRTIALCEDGTVWRWGSSSSRGQPERISGLEGKFVTKITCGLYECLALTETGEVFHWTNTEAYGDSDPLPLNGVDGVTFYDVVSGKFGSSAITTTGEIWTWKTNPNGSMKSNPAPIVSDTLQGKFCRELASGDTHFSVLAADATTGLPCIFGWGKNAYGELGLDGTQAVSENDAQPIIDLNGIEFSQLRCGGYHNAAVVGPWMGGSRFNLTSALREALRTALLADFTLKVDGIAKVWPVHKSLLTFRCKTPALKATVDSFSVQDLAKAQSLTEEHVDSVLEYIYTDRCPMSQDSAKKVMALARYLQIPGLIDICEARIQQRNRLGSKDNTIAKDMLLMLNSHYATDIAFFDPSDPSSEPLQAHRFVFAARCPYYNALWRQGWKEADARQLPLPFECSLGAFKSFVQFLYTDKLEVSGDDAVDLLALAHEMDMSALKNQCDRFISDAIDASTAIPLLQIATTFDANRMRHAALETIAKNKHLKSTEEYKVLPEEVKTLISQHETAPRQPARSRELFAPLSLSSNHYDYLTKRALTLKNLVQTMVVKLADTERYTEMEILSSFSERLEPIVKGQVNAGDVEVSLNQIEAELRQLESIFPPIKSESSKCSVM